MKIEQLTSLFITAGLLGCFGPPQSTGLTETSSDISVRNFSMTQEEVNGLDSVNIDFQFRGSCYAYSSDKNAEASHGEAHSDNLPKAIDRSFPRNGLYLTINQNDFSRIDSNFLGCKLYLVNTSDTLVTLQASDSRLYIVAEALNEKNEWTQISYLPSSWCGNSYHTVKLDKDEYWSFDIPVFKGTMKTKLRYILSIDNEKKIISNEVDTYLNKGQFDQQNKMGHLPISIMDPYND